MINDNLPNFSGMDIKGIPEQLKQKLLSNRQFIENLLTNNTHYTWNNLMQPLEEIDDEVDKLFSPLAHLNAVTNTPEIRHSYQACLPLLTEYATELGQHEQLYQAILSLKSSPQFGQLTAAQQRIIENDLIDFKLSGIALNDGDKQRYKNIAKRLSELTNKFDNNLLDATNAWQKHITDEALLAGIPEHAKATAAQLAKEQDKSGWILNLEFPCYLAVITYASNRSLREEIYVAFITRASDQGPYAGKWDNSEVMNEILQLRYEEAQLLNYASYAEVSLAKKMAQSPQQVLDFLTDLAQRGRPQAIAEFTALSAFAEHNLQLSPLQPWDVTYASEKLRQNKYAISQEELRPYFPQPKVLEGMFAIANKLYGIQIKSVTGIDTWHPDVIFYEIYDNAGDLCGQLYLDLYARAKKRGGAWMDDCINRRRLANGTLQIPVAYLTCNFAPPVENQDALFSHEEVETLFHEFGHCLHHLLTKVDFPAAAGTNGVEWDAVELPSQFFENWCWEYDSLQLFSQHYISREKLPRELFEKMINAKNFQSAMQLIRQLEFSLFDFRIHLEYQPGNHEFIQNILNDVRKQLTVVPVAPYNRFQHSFSHIFAGGYAAGYYSYKWAEVLSSDAYSKFEEHGIFNKEIGLQFLHSILEVGGSRPALESFIEFRGREPKIDALLKHSGIDA